MEKLNTDDNDADSWGESFGSNFMKTDNIGASTDEGDGDDDDGNFYRYFAQKSPDLITSKLNYVTSGNFSDGKRPRLDEDSKSKLQDQIDKRR